MAGEDSNITIFGQHETRTVQQLARCVEAEEGARGVLCADGHVGYSQPIGGAVAYREHISPSGAGFDLGCGNKAVKTDVLLDELKASVSTIADDIARRISFGMGRANDEPVDHPVLDRIRAAPFAPQRGLADLAAKQLGTVGGGNHYVDLFADEDGAVWVGVHFGSRGFGHKTASGFLALAQGRAFTDRAAEAGMDSDPVVFRIDSELGQSYIEAMTLAGEYAYAGRDVVVGKVLEMLGARSTVEVHNHHNFCIAGDQIVPTTTGPKRMDEVRPGDLVYAIDDKKGPSPTRVVNHWESGARPIVEIATRNRRLRCSGTHPIRVLDAGELVWRRADEIQEGEIVLCAEQYYPTDARWDAARARLIGAFLGDGWLRHNPQRQGYSVGLAIGTAGDAHTAKYLELVRAELPNTGWGSGWGVDRTGHFGLSCSSKSAWETVVDLGLGQRAREKRVPSHGFSLTRPAKLALLAGYFDADGSVDGPATSNHGRGTVATVSRDLGIGLREIAVGRGLQATVLRAERRTTNYGKCTVHCCVLSVDSVWQLPLWNEAKRANARQSLHTRPQGLAPKKLRGAVLPPGTFAQRVTAVTHHEAEPVWDLTVEHPSHSFVVEGVVTHNCWRETHDGEDWWVVRKGCTPAWPGQAGFVGSTMGETSVILEGTDAAERALYSTVHGAGRRLSRTQAKGKWKKGRQVKPGIVDFERVKSTLAEQGIELRGGDADEAPPAYKRLDEVLAEHGDTIEVTTRLTPLAVVMAGPDIFDPFRD